MLCDLGPRLDLDKIDELYPFSEEALGNITRSELTTIKAGRYACFMKNLMTDLAESQALDDFIKRARQKISMAILAQHLDKPVISAPEVPICSVKSQNN